MIGLFVSLPMRLAFSAERDTTITSCLCRAPRVGGLAREVTLLRRLAFAGTRDGGIFAAFDVGDVPLDLTGSPLEPEVAPRSYDGSALGVKLLASWLSRSGVTQPGFARSPRGDIRPAWAPDRSAIVLRTRLGQTISAPRNLLPETRVVLVAPSAADVEGWTLRSKRIPDLALVPRLRRETTVAGCPVRAAPVRDEWLVASWDVSGTLNLVRHPISEDIDPDPEVERELKAAGIR